MSPRRNTPKRNGRSAGRAGSAGGAGSVGDDRDDAPRSLGGWYLERTDRFRGEDWKVRPVDGGSGKVYRCPGCEQEIRPGVGHVVAWPEHAGADDRRHWHSACWNARERRGAAVQRSRNAPRY